MSIKDTIEDKNNFANQEIVANEKNQGYYFDAVKHIHYLDGQPLIGTSSMASVLAKPLTWWASGLAVAKLGWIHKGDKSKGFTPIEKRIEVASPIKQKIAEMTDLEYIALLDEAYKAHSVKLDSSAKAGTDMHEVMEEYIKYCINHNNSQPDATYKSPYVNVSDENKVKLQILVDWSVTKVKRFLWSEVHMYSKVLWLGGISDCGFEDMDGKYAVLDFKSSKEVYLSQFWQCWGYAIELEENGGFTPDGKKILTLDKPIDYVAVLPFGMPKPEVFYNVGIVDGKEAVDCMVKLYKKLN
jgi:hypothetical protein